MTGEHNCCVDPVEENEVVRNVAVSVEKAAARTRRTGLALVAVVAAIVTVTAIFTGYTAFRVREQNQFNEKLVLTIQEYNEAHAAQSADSFEAIRNNIACMADFFTQFNNAVATGQPVPDKAILDACFQPVTPAPPPPPETEKKGNG
ncbi:MAG: hypothetical protein LC798_19100 [Chloroflexi bacterium]|nr:hypothetical protein [Chloroflexota bacterium]